MAGRCGLRGHHGVHVRYAQRHYTQTLTRSSWLIEMFPSRLCAFCKMFAVAIKALKCKPSAPYASVMSKKQIRIVAHVYYITAATHTIVQLLSGCRMCDCCHVHSQ